MKMSLSENIARLRRERSMTQEQLAEALGVSFAAVSKWERGAATPELNLIAEMADLFEVSMDALIGYQFRNNDRQTVIARLKGYLHNRDSDDVCVEIEKSLKRYPNCFEIVYTSARIYRVWGLVQNKNEYAQRALSLYRQACMLIGQNTDLEISETSIRNEMAQAYLALGEYEKGLEILKQYTPCRLNHSLIGLTLAADCGDTEGALPYLSMALLDLTEQQTRIVTGYLNVYIKNRNMPEALAVADWALAFYPGLRAPGKQSYMHKSEATIWAVRAGILLSLGRREEAAESLRRAKALALQFDEAPNYDAASVRFVSIQKPMTAFDNLGETTMRGLDSIISQFQESPELPELWRWVKNEA